MSTTFNSGRLSHVSWVLVLSFAAAAAADLEFGGHVKTRLLADAYPSNSFFDPLTGGLAAAAETEVRTNLRAAGGSWSFDASWQLFAGYGDRVELTRDLAGAGLPGAGHLPGDDRRLLGLTDVLGDRGKFASVQRLDRLSVGYARDQFVLRLGRQAITWGNGLVFSPMDIVNPFDPTAVDTEYKAGDDMLYGQYLRGNGDDLQIARVFRRDPVSGDVESAAATTALKYHGILGDGEYDLLLANHYDDWTIGLGGNRSIGGAVLRGDAVWADTGAGGRLQLVANLSYSWVWGGRNASGLIEYFYSEFGLPGGGYDLASLSENTQLLRRLERGESFTLGRHYLAGGVTIELTPLWQLTPNLFANLDDESALLQLVTRLSLGDEAEFLAALNLPIGPTGTEYGGIETTLPGEYLATEFSLFAQFAWYF